MENSFRDRDSIILEKSNDKLSDLKFKIDCDRLSIVISFFFLLIYFCFWLIPIRHNSSSTRKIRYRRCIFEHYSHIKPDSGTDDPVSEISKLTVRSRVCGNEKRYASIVAFSAETFGRDLKLLKQYISSFNDHSWFCTFKVFSNTKLLSGAPSARPFLHRINSWCGTGRNEDRNFPESYIRYILYMRKFYRPDNENYVNYVPLVNWIAAFHTKDSHFIYKRKYAMFI